MLKTLEVLFYVSILIICIQAGNYYTTDEGKKFYVENFEKLSWFKAMSDCTSRNMTLVAPYTEKKHLELTKAMSTFKVPYSWMAGLETENFNFMWITTGKELTYTHWREREPNRVGDEINCVEIVVDSYWISNNCKLKLHYMCEEHPQIEIFKNSCNTEKQNLAKCQKDVKSCDLNAVHSSTMEVNDLKNENQLRLNQLLVTNQTLDLKSQEMEMLKLLHQNEINLIQEKHNNTLNMLKLSCDLKANQSSSIKNYNVLFYTQGNRN